MAHKVGDRIKEQANTTGTGAFTFTGAFAGFKTFASKLSADGDTTWYMAVNGDEWEAGLGTRTSASTMARTTVLESSNGNAPVSFTAAPIVFGTIPSSVMPAVSSSYAFRARLSANVAWPSGVHTKVTLNTKDFDTGNCFDTATGRFTPTTPGYYAFKWEALGSSMGLGMSAVLRKNGVSASEGSWAAPVGSDGRSVGSDVIYLNGTTDYAELWAYMGGASPILVAGVSETHLSGHLISPVTTPSGGPAFSASHNSGVALAATGAGTLAKVPYTFEDYDTNNCYDAANSRFQPNVAGFYQISIGLGVTSPILIPTLLSIGKNGVEHKRGFQTDNAQVFNQSVSALVYLNGATDYVEAMWLCNAARTSAGNATQCYFQGYLARMA